MTIPVFRREPGSIQKHMAEKVFAKLSDHTGKIPLVKVQTFADLCLMHPNSTSIPDAQAMPYLNFFALSYIQ